jgi:zinc protease
MQLLYLGFTQPRKDETAFKTAIQQQIAFVENRNGRAETVFNDEVSRSLYKSKPRPPSVSSLRKISHNRTYDIYKERFANAGDFRFFFVGNFDMATMRTLVPQYIGSLPGSTKHEKAKGDRFGYSKKAKDKTVLAGSEPKGMVRLTYTGKADYSLKNEEALQAFVKLLSIKLREAIREDKGGTYGVQVSGWLSKEPKQRYIFNVNFGCDPARTQELTDVALQVIETVKKEGAKEADMLKIRETKRRETETDFKENRYWINSLNQVWEDNLPHDAFKNPDTVCQYVNSLTSDDYKKMANKYLDNSKLRRFTMLPKKAVP